MVSNLMTTIESEPKHSEEYKNLLEIQTEIEACSLSPQYFLTKYAWIINKNTAKIVKWQPWQYQLDLIDIILHYDDIVVPKARQEGVTWTVPVGLGLWYILFHDAAKVLLMSANEDPLVYETISKIKFMWEHLPAFLKQPFESETRKRLQLKGRPCEIQGLPSTERAGAGMDATFVVRDEVRDHEYGRGNFVAVSPAIDGGGKLVDISTYNKFDLTNHFSQRVMDAYRDSVRVDYPSGLVLFKKETQASKKTIRTCMVFLGRDLRPNREEGLTNQEWFDLKIVPKYSKIEIEQEYPQTFEEMISHGGIRSFFEAEATEAMWGYVQEPLLGNLGINTHDGIVQIYKPPVVGRKYIFYTDPSDGVDDPFHTVGIDAQTYEGVCEASGKVRADECAKIHDELVRAYNNAYNTFEYNASPGGKFSESIKALETPGLAPRRDLQTGHIIKDKMGMAMSPSYKKIILDGLEEAVRKRLITVHSKYTIQQFKSMIIPEDGVPQVPRGLHDDAIMAWAGVWHLRKFAPLSGGGVTLTSSVYKE